MGKGKFWILLLLALLLFSLDATTKHWVYHHLSLSPYSSPFYSYGEVGVFHNLLGIDFCISRVSNSGGAWGVFASYPKTLLFFRILIILFLAIYTFFINKVSKRTLPFLLILVGASGNIIDFFIYGSVVDMFHFVFWGYSYPVFNVADTLIFIGVFTLFVQTLFEKRKKKSCYATQSSKS
ncbi:MAG: signal peptidase II [Chlamydiia bacterium]|nr:signal peptidase II [Chlamydiia bacterium]